MAYTLTKTDINALRQADRLVVLFNGRDAEKCSYVAIKQLSDKEREAQPFAEHDRRYHIPVGAQNIRISGYGYNGCSTSYLTAEQQAEVTAFAHVYLFHSQATEESTIVNSLRVGDEISLEFVANCGNEMLRERGLACDELRLHVVRGSKCQRLQFLLRYEVCESHSIARMIRGLPTIVKSDAAA